jgi:nucleoid DNA-binding protein
MAYRETGARFSIDRRYRYALWRVWDHDENLYNFLLLNPSSADEATNDPTIERCERRARRWGFGGLIVTNLFALCATDPAGLHRIADPIGPENDAAILETAQGCNRALERTVLLKGGLQPPSGGPGLKAVLERPCSPIRGDEGEDLLKGSRSRGISGEIGGLALHPLAFSGKESGHPLIGPRPGLVPGFRRSRARRTRSRPSTPCRSIPTTMAKKAAPKAAQGKAAPAPSAKAAPKAADTPAPARPKPANRAEVYTALAETTGLGKKEVTAVFSALGALIAKELGKNGPGQFVVPGLLKLKVVRKPATKARPGTNPFTGEPMTIRAKPAHNVVRALPLKALKEMV